MSLEPVLPSERPPQPLAVYTERGPYEDVVVDGPVGTYSSLAWVEGLSAYDMAAATELDRLLTSGLPTAEAPERYAHDLALYLCDWLVVNGDRSWLVREDGTAELRLNREGDIADPYRSLVRAVVAHEPLAVRFVTHCLAMMAEPLA